jgi:hypothetical protein
MQPDPLDALIADLEQALPPRVSVYDHSAEGFAKLIAATDRVLYRPDPRPRPDEASPAAPREDTKATKS